MFLFRVLFDPAFGCYTAINVCVCVCSSQKFNPFNASCSKLLLFEGFNAILF